MSNLTQMNLNDEFNGEREKTSQFNEYLETNRTYLKILIDSL